MKAPLFIELSCLVDDDLRKGILFSRVKIKNLNPEKPGDLMDYEITVYDDIAGPSGTVILRDWNMKKTSLWQLVQAGYDELILRKMKESENTGKSNNEGRK